MNIETNIPIPEKIKLGRPEIYPWSSLGVGQSFFVESPPKAGLKTQAYLAGKRMNAKFKAVDMDGGVRVWRVA